MTSSEEPGMPVRRILTHGPESEPLWARLYVQEIEEAWAGMIVVDDESPSAPGTLKGIAFFGDTAEEAERLAVAYLSEGVAQN